MPKATATRKIETKTSIKLTTKEIAAAIDMYVSGFDVPITENDIDWNFKNGILVGCTIEVVTVETDMPTVEAKKE